MSDADEIESKDALWREFETAFGSKSNTPDTTQTDPDQDRDAPLNQSSDIDAADVIQKLEAMGKCIPKLPIRVANSQPPSKQSLVTVPPVSVELEKADDRDSSLRFETKVMGVVKVGEKSLVMLRLTVPGFRGQCHIRVVSDLFDVPFDFVVPMTGELSVEAGPVRFVPCVAGVDQLDFDLNFIDSDGVPSNRLRGQSMLKINPSESTGMLHAGGDIIVVGQSMPRFQSNTLADLELLEWNPVTLVQDASFLTYQRQILPEPDEESPDIKPLGPLHQNQSGVIYSRQNGIITCFAVVTGAKASVGRGGATDTSWWIRPTTKDQRQFTRISRKHFTVELRAKHAWIVDHSANGTLLNGKELSKDKSTVLGTGDRIDLAGAMLLSVRLFSDGTKVTGLQLDRDDALRGRLFLILSLSNAGCRIQTAGAKFWCVWKENGGMGLNDGSGGWKNVMSGETVRIINQTDVAWHTLPGSIDQDHLFPGK